MSKQKLRVNVLVKGGILTPSYLLLLTGIAKENGNDTIGFGSRQQVLFDVFPEKKNEVEAQLTEKGFEFEWLVNNKVKVENIVSSFPAHDIQPSTFWIGASTFISILEQFGAPVSLRVNIVDPKQNLVPNYGGHLNFIASETEHYWHLVIKKVQDADLIEWPVLVHQDDIAKLVYFLEELFIKKKDVNRWAEYSKKSSFKSLNSKNAIPVSNALPEYYEGFNLMYSSTKYWVGFYWRNNKYLISFLEEVCELCLRSSIARISITPWKSFLIKDVNREDRLLWEQLTGRRGINMRHSSFDLFWHVPYGSNENFKLKQHIVRKMDKMDIRTFGLTFGIGRSEFPIATVVIEEQLFLSTFNIPWLNDYTIYCAQDFDTKTGKYEKVSEKISRKEIYGILIELSKRYYLKLNNRTIKKRNTKIIVKTDKVYQCKDCMSIYHPQFGDDMHNIPSGTAFDALPEKYCCSTCGADKAHFFELEMASDMFSITGR